jgi:hypothetical protein
MQAGFFISTSLDFKTKRHQSPDLAAKGHDEQFGTLISE